MPWTQKQMLRDANGDLIPQYWDVVEQEFKPLTGSDGANDVRLTGSIKEEFIVGPGEEINIPAGAEHVFPVQIVDCDEISLAIIRNSRHYLSEAHISFGYANNVAPDNFYYETLAVLDPDESRIPVTDRIKVKTPYVYIKIINKTSSNQVVIERMKIFQFN